MSEDKKDKDLKPSQEETVKVEVKEVSEDKKSDRPDFGGKKPMRRPMRSRRPDRGDKPRDDFEQKMVDLARVTRVMAGGKRMKFRACMVIGDKKGKIGVGIAKGVDVAAAIQKAVAKARKNIIHVPIVNGTIPHEVNIKEKSSRLMMKPGKKGSGIKAGGVMRIVLELAGVKDVVGKMLGTNNKINNTKTAVKALNSFIGQSEVKSDMPKKVAPRRDEASDARKSADKKKVSKATNPTKGGVSK